ncbi:MAG: hypothetical protein Q4B96_05540 [Bacillota bacterium]|nr:hypothetical protein [Bacillota bacterium]
MQAAARMHRLFGRCIFIDNNKLYAYNIQQLPTLWKQTITLRDDGGGASGLETLSRFHELKMPPNMTQSRPFGKTENE